MAFIDQAILVCKAGKGGDGCVAFRREKYIPMGGPNGGDGGRGGSIFLEATHQTNSLAQVHRMKSATAKSGSPGSGSQKTGRSGEDIIIPVPVGTCIFDAEHDDAPIIADLSILGQRVLIANGGEGGLGNIRFKSSTNRSPRQSTPGKPGDEIRIRLELRVMADVGLLGLPNAGKSSLLRQVSSATPKVADYAFTTTKPHVGVVHYNQFDSFVMADIPGLIEGAAQGLGMGDRFLKHLMRCRVLIHLVDGASPIHEQVVSIEKELNEYGPELSNKPRLLVINKVDLLSDEELDLVSKECSQHGYEFLVISAKTGQGCKELISSMIEFL